MLKRLKRWCRKHDVLLGIAIVVVISSFMTVLEYSGALAGVDGKFQDWFWLRHGKELNSRNIIVLEIDDDAYKYLFDSQSPVDPYILTDLIRKIAAVRPAVLGVDVLTTSDSHHGPVYQAFADQVSGLGTPTVWIADMDKAHVETRAPSLLAWLLLGREDELLIQPTEVLGHDLRYLNQHRDEIFWGPALYPSDQDLKVRRFPTTINVTEDIECRVCAWPKPSFAQVVADKYCEPPGSTCKALKGKEIYLSVAGDPPKSYQLSNIFELDGPKHVKLKSPWDHKLPEIAAGKIVLLGGTFGTSDLHKTAEGDTYGVFTHARAIAAELSGFGYREISQPRSFLLDLVFGSGTVLILAYLKRRGWEARDARGMLIRSGFVISALLLIAFGMWLFAGYLSSVAAVVIAATVQQLWDFWHDNPRIRKSELRHSS